MTAFINLPLAAALPEKPGILESIGYQLNGVLVVFLALASIWLLLEIIGRVFKRRAADAPTAVAPVAALVAAPATAAAAPAPAPGIAPEVIAAVTAAVHQVLGSRARIAAIVPVPNTPWAHEGRRQIFSSHQPR